MTINEKITGIQHLGLPTADFEKTVEFYKGLGFEVCWKAEKFPLAFLKLGNIMIETMQRPNANQVWGAWDHVAINVTDVDAVWAEVNAAGCYNIVEGADGPRKLPFFENGVKYFTIEGPNKEKIEFNQIL